MTFQCGECHNHMNINNLAFTYTYCDADGVEHTEGVCGDCTEE